MLTLLGLPEVPSEGPKRVSAAPTKTPLGARMGCTTNPSTEDHEVQVLGPNGFTTVSAMTSHDLLPWLFVDTAAPFRYLFPLLQRTTDTSRDLDPVYSIYFH